MDIVHHAAIGAVGMLSLSAAGHEAAGLAFLAGSAVPDLDVAFMALGKRFYLRHHQEISHSLPLSPLVAAGIAALFAPLVGVSVAVFGAALAAVWLHVALDWSNTFGIAPLAPFSSRRVSLDSVFFIDAPAWVATVTTIGALTLWPAWWIGASYAVAGAAYVAVRTMLHRQVLRALGCAVAIPSSWNPLAYYTFSENGAYRTSIYDVLTGRERGVVEIPRADARFEALARKSTVFRDMLHIARALRITEVRADQDGTTILARDLAVRNFGGYFARTELRFDAGGNLVDETAAV